MLKKYIISLVSLFVVLTCTNYMHAKQMTETKAIKKEIVTFKHNLKLLMDWLRGGLTELSPETFDKLIRDIKTRLPLLVEPIENDAINVQNKQAIMNLWKEVQEHDDDENSVAYFKKASKLVRCIHQNVYPSRNYRIVLGVVIVGLAIVTLALVGIHYIWGLKIILAAIKVIDQIAEMIAIKLSYRIYYILQGLLAYIAFRKVGGPKAVIKLLISDASKVLEIFRKKECEGQIS